MGPIKFTVRAVAMPSTGEVREYVVEAVCPAAGGDSALIAVFNSDIAARSLAHVLNTAAALPGVAN